MNLFIFHRDLRLIDNTSLIHQLRSLPHKKVTPAFIFTPQQTNPTENKYFCSNSVQFMVESLRDLNKQVQKFNGKMVYYYGDNLEILRNLDKRFKINSIGFNLDYTPYAKRRDGEIMQWAKERGIKMYCKEDYALYDLMQVNFMGKNNTPPTFTPFKQYCYQNLKVREPDTFNDFSFQTLPQLFNLQPISYDFQKQSSQLYENNKNLAVHGGREEAMKIVNGMEKFTKYFEDRNFPALPATKLSAYLHFTNVSVREVYHKVVGLLGKEHHLVFELHCRQFFTYITHKFPNVLKQDLTKNLNPQFDALNVKWNQNTQHLQRWKQGTTGIPFIDAGMRQMNTTGYMHNRTRQNVACFLVKDLFIDWKEGEKYFAQMLVDYSATQNSGNWQYVAGVGTDPREVRIFNPWLQAKKYDSKCVYIKRWVPQLSDVPYEDILKWEETCKYYLQKGVKYYEPIVNHEAQTKIAQKVYRNIIANLYNNNYNKNNQQKTQKLYENDNKMNENQNGQNKKKTFNKIVYQQKPKSHHKEEETRKKKIEYKEKQ